MALAVGGAVLAAVTEVVGRTLVRWTRGFDTLGRIERVDRALDRIGRDLDGLVAAPGVSSDPTTVFVGAPDRFAFLARTALSQSEDGLAVVDVAVGGGPDRGGVTRGWRRLDGGGTGRTRLGGDGLDVAFAYVDHRGRRSADWSRKGEVPAGVVVAMRGPARLGGLPSEILLPIRARLSVSCLAGRLTGIGAPRRGDAEGGQALFVEQSVVSSDTGELTFEPPPHCRIDGSEAAETDRPRGPGSGG